MGRTDYRNGKIYRLFSKKTNDYYIGSTVQTLPQRLRDHLAAHKKWKSEIGWDLPDDPILRIIDGGEYVIELLEQYPCESRKELQSREGVYQKKYSSADQPTDQSVN